MEYFDAKVIETSSENFLVWGKNKKIFVKMSGKLRLSSKRPAVINDKVKILCDGSSCLIEKIYEPINYFSRPRCANITRGIIVVSLIDPVVDIRKVYLMIMSLALKFVSATVCFTKKDIAKDNHENLKHFESLKTDGFPYIIINNNDFKEIDFFAKQIKNKTTVLMGESGVGKSSLFNNLLGYKKAVEGTINRKLKRGNHTTSHHALIPILGGFLIDTPGFMKIRIDNENKNVLSKAYLDFNKYATKCKFRNCLHIEEKDCFVKKKLKENKISDVRYNLYKKLIRENR